MAKRLKRERRLGEKRSETETKTLMNVKRFRNKIKCNRSSVCQELKCILILSQLSKIIQRYQRVDRVSDESVVTISKTCDCFLLTTAVGTKSTYGKKHCKNKDLYMKPELFIMNNKCLSYRVCLPRKCAYGNMCVHINNSLSDPDCLVASRVVY